MGEIKSKEKELDFIQLYEIKSILIKILIIQIFNVLAVLIGMIKLTR